MENIDSKKEVNIEDFNLMLKMVKDQDNELDLLRINLKSLDKRSTQKYKNYEQN